MSGVSAFQAAAVAGSVVPAVEGVPPRIVQLMERRVSTEEMRDGYTRVRGRLVRAVVLVPVTHVFREPYYDTE